MSIIFWQTEKWMAICPDCAIRDGSHWKLSVRKKKDKVQIPDCFELCTAKFHDRFDVDLDQTV